MSEFRLNKYLFIKEFDKVVLIKNLLNNVIFAITKKKYDQLSGDLNLLKKTNENLFSAMKKLYVVVPLEYDEMKQIMFLNRTEVFDSKYYRLTINPTLDCNFKCWYCYEDHPKGGMTKDIMDSVIKHVNLKIENEGLKHLLLDWFGGEPLLYFDEVVYPLMKKIKALCDKKNVSFLGSMTTNGYLINKKRIELFNEVGLRDFQITLDGDKKRHDKIRFSENRSPSFDIIVENINNLTENNDVTILLRINYTEKTLLEINNLVNYFSDNSKKKITISFQQVWQDSIKRSVSADENINYLEGNGFRVKKNRAMRKGHVCYADLKNQSIINFDGRVFKCTARDFNNIEEDGLLLDDGEIKWNGSLLARRLGSATFENEYCINCSLLPSCLGPCSQKLLEFDKEKDDFRKICLKGGVKQAIDEELEEFYNREYANFNL